MRARAMVVCSAGVAALAGAPAAMGQWWWPPEMGVDPPCVGPASSVTITLSGSFPDACVPNAADVVRGTGTIDLNTRREPPPGFCLQVISTWSLPVIVGTLPAGTYAVYATHYRDGAPVTDRALLGMFTVNPSCGGGCYPNCDGSTQAPVLNVLDFTCFLQRFAAGDAYANCDASTAAPTLNVQDFTCFLQKFAAGCP